MVENDRAWATVVESTSPARETSAVSKAVCLREKRKMQEGRKAWTLGWDSYSRSRVFSDGDPLVVAMRNPPTVGVDRTLKIFVSQ